MKTVDEMIEDILRREGGFVDDPDDAGGATKHGISLRYMRGIGLDLDGDGDVDGEDVRLVDRETAAHLYRLDFLCQPKIDKLPAGLQPQMFDIAVNAGPHQAVLLLQRVLNDNFIGEEIRLYEDGRLGPKSIGATQIVVLNHGWQKVNNLLAQERIDFYGDLCKRRPSQYRFLRGWVNRAREFIVE